MDYALPGIVIPKVILLLAIHLRDDPYDVLLFVCQYFFRFMLTSNLPDYLQYLP